MNDLQASTDLPKVSFSHAERGSIGDTLPMVQRLYEEFEGTFSFGTIERLFHDTLLSFGNARVTAFVPLLAQRHTREHLLTAARSSTVHAKAVLDVLFVCSNAAYGVIVASLFEHRAPNRSYACAAIAASSGEASAPAPEALAALGVQPTSYEPRKLQDELIAQANVVVTVGRDDACQIIPGRRYIDWSLPEFSAGEGEHLRRLRHHIDQRVQELVLQL